MLTQNHAVIREGISLSTEQQPSNQTAVDGSLAELCEQLGSSGPRLKEIFLAARGPLAAFKTNKAEIGRLFAEARSLLKVPGCKGGFSRFLKLCGGFPRSTADEWADAYEAAQGLSAEASLATQSDEDAGEKPSTVRVPCPKAMTQPMKRMIDRFLDRYENKEEAQRVIAKTIIDALSQQLKKSEKASARQSTPASQFARRGKEG